MNKELPDQSLPNTSFPKIETTGVKTLLGEPKRAIIKLALPMIVAMSVQTIYNFEVRANA